MFRKIKKKPVTTATKRSSVDETTDIEASPGVGQEDPVGATTSTSANVLLQKKKQRRAPKSGIRTGTTAGTAKNNNRPESSSGGSDNRTTVRVQKRPRAAGLGYGGTNLMPSSSSDNNNVPINDTTSPDAATESQSRYDSNTLSQLRQQQDNFQAHHVTPDDNWDGQGVSQGQDTASGRNGNATTTQFFKPNNDDDDFGIGRNFIPIDGVDGMGDDDVLTGDEAMAFANEQQQQIESQKSSGRTMDSILEGVGGGQASSSTAAQATVRGSNMQNTKTEEGLQSPHNHVLPSLTLRDVHQQFSQTQERLHQQADELEKSLIRRHEAKQETQEQAEKHRQDLKKTGGSLEFYQTWRRDLIAFVGALREITKALPDMQNAWHELEQDMAGILKWRDWEDDTFAVLTRYKLVQSVVGRHPTVSADLLTDKSSEVDEFGRDIVSQKQRILQQRRLERRKIRKETVVENGVKQKIGSWAGSDGSVSPHLNSHYAYPNGYPVLSGPSEMETFRERNKALQNALKIVLDNLYEDYTSLPQLFELFSQWKRSFPLEYKECYASLTLADLATVLILVELLSLNDPLNESGGHDEAKWMTTVCRHYNCGDYPSNVSINNGSDVQLFDKESIERLVSKTVIPTLQDLLSQKRTYNLLSYRQSKALSTFLSHAQRLLTKDHPVLRMLHKVVVDYIQQSLHELSIPIIVHQKLATDRLESVSDDTEKELLGQTIHDATIGQIERVKKIVLNMFDCWANNLPPESGFPSVILQFISSKVVPLLSALQTWYWPSLAESPSDVFVQFWEEIQKHDWLDQPEYSIHSTILKATAGAFRIERGDKDDTVMGDLASDPVIHQQ